MDQDRLLILAQVTMKDGLHECEVTTWESLVDMVVMLEGAVLDMAYSRFLALLKELGVKGFNNDRLRAVLKLLEASGMIREEQGAVKVTGCTFSLNPLTEVPQAIERLKTRRPASDTTTDYSLPPRVGE